MDDTVFNPEAWPVPPAPVDPQLQEFLRRMASEGAKYPRRDMVPVAQGRAITEKVRAQWTAGGPQMARTEDIMAPTRHGQVQLRVYTPRVRKLAGCLFYIHGGGFVLFSIDTHDRVMREYADRAGILVVGINYTRAPEAKFPQALDECLDSVQWLRANAGRFGFDAGQLFVGGDSAGGNLTMGISLTLRDAGLPPVAGMVLNYAGYDMGDDHLYAPSVLRYGNGEYGLSLHMMLWFRLLYIDRSRVDPRMSPLLARVEGLPPSYMVITECDVLYDENIEMVEHLRKAGCQVEAKVYPGTVHSFLEAVSISDAANQAFDDTVKWLNARARAVAG
jgi:acetyl esterase